ncbi:MAG TPA: hypothetical protein VMT18_16215, partial [Planctomycetota bacterium]|nr:hypothetical protein [Planctomycetota bacterium]
MRPTLATLALGLTTWAAQERAVEPQVPVAAPPPLIVRLRGDPHFAKLPLQEASGFPPIDMVLQEPYGANPGWGTAPSNRFGPWAREVVRQFEERFAEPLALKRAPRFGPPAMVVLSSEGDLLNFRRSPTGRRSTSYSEASYAFGLDAVVVSAKSSQGAPHLARFPGLHLIAYRELVAHSADGARPPFWLGWGLPAYLAWSTGFGPESLRTRELDRNVLMDWLLTVRKSKDGNRTLMPVLDLVGAADAEAGKAAMRVHAARFGAQPDDDLGHLLWCATCLWTHYLLDGEDGRWRDGFGAYLAGALRGRTDAALFREAMQLDDAGVRALDRGFEAWVIATGVERGVIGLENGPVTQTEPVEVAPALPPLEPQPDEVALGHGLALAQAREGDLDGAIAQFEALLAVDPEGAYAQRVARDLERARGFRELRAAFLARLAESGDLLRLERDGKRLNVRVATVEADRITLRETRGGLDAIPFAELASFQVAREMGRDAGWLRLWPYALVDDERWQRLLDESEPGAREMSEDAAEWYPGALRLGEVARELHAIGAGEPPEDPSAALALTERIGALLREHGALAEVEGRLPALRARAAELLEQGWSAERVGEGLAGALERLEGERMRLTYAFDDGAELAELAPGPGYPSQRMEGRPTLLGEATSTVARGALRLSGSLTCRLPLAFRAPLEARMRLAVGDVPDGGTIYAHWSLGVCDDSQGNLV